MIRRNGVLEEVTWNEALDHVARRLPTYAGDSFAILTSPNSTNEEHYLAQKFARLVMNTNNVDQTSNTQPELTDGLERSLGYAAATNPIWDLEQAGCILVFNSNVTEEHNVVGVPIKRAARKDTKLVVIDPREVELTRYADVWLRPAPGTELLLLGGVLRSLIDQGLQRDDWLEENCESPATLYYALHNLDMDEVSRVTHVSLDDMAEAARLYGEAGAAAIVYALDNVSSGLRADCVRALVDLSLLTGNVGKVGAGLYPMRQGANEQGAWDVGCVPDRLPGHRLVRDVDARAVVAEAWGSGVPETPGLRVTGAVEAAADGLVKAMMVIGNPVNFTNGKLGNGVQALSNLDFLVVQDTFAGPLTEIADVVLPRVTFAEKDGTFTNLERRVQRFRPAIQVTNNDARPESWVICELASRMGARGFNYLTATQVMEEIASLCPIYGGVSYHRLEEGGRLVLRTDLNSPQPTQVLHAGKEYPGIQWPCPAEDAPDTGTLYAEGFPSGNAVLEAPPFRTEEAADDSEFPSWLVPGRVLFQQGRDMEVVRGKRNHIRREEQVELNPVTAGSLAAQDGDRVEVRTRSGSDNAALIATVRLTEEVPEGVISTTSLFGQLAEAMQMSPEPDPAAGVAGLDIHRAAIVKLE